MYTTIVQDGKRKTIKGYLDELKTMVETVKDDGVLDHMSAKLLPIVMSVRANSETVLDEPTEDFDVIDRFAPAQKNETQLRFHKVESAGRRKTHHPMK